MRFTIIATHYDGVIKHEDFCRGIKSLQDQTFQDFELLCFHDGPLTDESVDLPCEVQFTEERYNDWGHTLRNIGIDQATGDYIIHFNVDNLLYKNALEELNKRIELDNPNIIIYFIKMMGMVKNWNNGAKPEIYYDHPRDYNKWELLTGFPPIFGNVDCMQLIMKRELWEKETWYLNSEQSDGLLYEKFGSKYGYKHVYKILGEHY